MRPKVFPILFLMVSISSFGQEWNDDQKEILATIEELSKATAPDGGGPEPYGEVLDENFSRWTLGSKKMETKTSWVEGIREWFDQGWRVSERVSEIKEITIKEDLAFVRRIVSETYSGPKDETTDPSRAALSEIWIRKDSWKLLRVDIAVLD